jgi:hypothetical protein
MENDQFPSRRGPQGTEGNRIRAEIACDVRQGSRPWVKVCLEDISTTGFRIASFPACRPEIAVRIRIPGLQILNASVVWKEGDAVGCEFTQPLHVAVFEHIVRQSGG